METVSIKLIFIQKTNQYIHQLHLQFNQDHLQRATQGQEMASIKTHLMSYYRIIDITKWRVNVAIHASFLKLYMRFILNKVFC